MRFYIIFFSYFLNIYLINATAFLTKYKALKIKVSIIVNKGSYIYLAYT